MHYTDVRLIHVSMESVEVVTTFRGEFSNISTVCFYYGLPAFTQYVVLFQRKKAVCSKTMYSNVFEISCDLKIVRAYTFKININTINNRWWLITIRGRIDEFNKTNIFVNWNYTYYITRSLVQVCFIVKTSEPCFWTVFVCERHSKRITSVSFGRSAKMTTWFQYVMLTSIPLCYY